MFYKLIENKRNAWLASDQCTVHELLNYIEQRAMMRAAQLEDFIKKNNEHFGYRRFEFLYLEDTPSPEQRRIKTEQVINSLFKR